MEAFYDRFGALVRPEDHMAGGPPWVTGDFYDNPHCDLPMWALFYIHASPRFLPNTLAKLVAMECAVGPFDFEPLF